MSKKDNFVSVPQLRGAHTTAISFLFVTIRLINMNMKLMANETPEKMMAPLNDGLPFPIKAEQTGV